LALSTATFGSYDGVQADEVAYQGDTFIAFTPGTLASTLSIGSTIWLAGEANEPVDGKVENAHDDRVLVNSDNGMRSGKSPI
jgi:hypothetical protein